MQRDNLDLGMLKQVALNDLRMETRITGYILIGLTILAAIIVFGALYLFPEEEPARTEFAKVSSRWMTWFAVLAIGLVYLSLSKLPTAYNLLKLARRFNAEMVFSEKISPWRMARVFLVRTVFRFCIWIGLTELVRLSFRLAPLPEPVKPMLFLLISIWAIWVALRWDTWLEWWAVYRPLYANRLDVLRHRLERLNRLIPTIKFDNWYSVLLFYEGKLDEALEMHPRILRNAAQTGIMITVQVTLLNWATMLIAAERYAESLPFLEAVIRINPRFQQPYEILINYYLEQGFAPERVDELIRAFQLITRNHEGLGLAQLRSDVLQGKTEGKKSILDAFQAEVAQNPKLFPIYKAMIFRIIGDLYHRLGEDVEAEQAWQQAYRLNPEGLVGRRLKKDHATIF